MLWDLDREWVVRREDLLSRHPWTPFEGRRIRGAVAATVRRGELAYADGEVRGRAGGLFLAG